MRRNIRICQLNIAVFALCAFASACTEAPKARPTSEDPYANAPAHVSYQIKAVFHEDAKTKAILEANVARIFEDKQETTLSDSVVVRFYSVASGKQIALLTADSAVVDDKTKAMTAIGNVIVWSDSSHTSLKTERMLWDNQTGLLSSNNNVEIKSPTEHIFGTGFVSDQYLTRYRITNVRGTHQ